MTDASKLDGIKPGVRVRVTVEFVVTECRYGIYGATDDDNVLGFGPETLDDPSFKIERIEPPLAVGDRVKNAEARTGVIRSIHECGVAWVEWDIGRLIPHEFATLFLFDLERIP